MSNLDVRSPNRVLSERIQFVACAILVVFVMGWIGWFFPFDDLLDRSGTPLGADFSMFYVAGQVVWDGAGERLYDQTEHQRRLQQLFPAIDSSFALPYRYPPCVATLMAPLAALPYPLAYAVFFALSCAAWWTAARQLVSVCPELRNAWQRSLRWAILGWPVALETLVGGQASMFALLIAVSVYALLQNHRWVLAGAILALAAYKPNVLALLALGCLIRYPRMLKGFVPMAAGVGLLCLVPNGWEGLLQYRELTANLATQSWDVATPLWKVHGLAPWFHFTLGDDGRLACGLMGIAATCFVALRARVVSASWGTASWGTASLVKAGTPIEPMWFATLISLNALFNAYTPTYDLVLLLIGAALTAEHVVRQHGPNVSRTLVTVQLLLATVYFGPHLSQVIAKSTGVQPFGLVFAGLAAWQVGLLLQSQREPAASRDQLLTSVSG
ncbi:MAG TPA: glycosyltransferase family 87 protein [Pirellulaceae bacterium]|nr:glycosyltransferase family 87 protein [Pirellulaceae bacterium]